MFTRIFSETPFGRGLPLASRTGLIVPGLQNNRRQAMLAAMPARIVRMMPKMRLISHIDERAVLFTSGCLADHGFSHFRLFSERKKASMIFMF